MDEIQGLSIVQVAIDIYWYDPRFNMPLFWEQVPYAFSGVDLTAALKNESIVMWRPHLTFPDAADATLLSEVRITPDLYFFCDDRY